MDGPNRGGWIRVEWADMENIYWLGDDTFYLVERDDDLRKWRATQVELNGLGILFKNA